jgi:hypothetical protein
MGLTDKLLAAGGVALVGAVVRNALKGAEEARREAEETERRRLSPLRFDERLTQSDFSDLVQNVAASTPRVAVARVDGMTVTLYVASISGLSTWKAEIDFNDYGRLSGAYWLDSENSDSSIPEHFADMVRAQINSRMTGALSETGTGLSSVGIAASSGSPASPAALPPAGWYPDPYRTARLRYWDGRAWTGYAAP